MTGDHGVTDSGGHAGPEDEVVRVPLVGTAGPIGEMQQRDVHRIVLAALGIGPLPESPAPSPGVSSWIVAAFALLLMAIVGGVILNGEESRNGAGILDVALWLSLAAALFGPPWLPLLLAFGALAVAIRRRGAFGLSSAALAAGAVGGTLRLLDPTVFPELVLPAALVLGAGAGWLAGRRLGTRTGAVLAGVLAALLAALVARLAGETVSLSTLDVRAAFRIVDGTLGLGGAVAVAALRQMAPALAVVLGIAPALARTRHAAAFSAGLASALAGQAAVAALVLLESGDLALASKSVSLLARLVGELSALFLGCAMGVELLSRLSGAATVPGPGTGA